MTLASQAARVVVRVRYLCMTDHSSKLAGGGKADGFPAKDAQEAAQKLEELQTLMMVFPPCCRISQQGTKVSLGKSRTF